MGSDMNKSVDIIVELKENKSIDKLLNDNLKRFNESIIGAFETKPFYIYIMNKDELIGGIKGDIFGSLCRVLTVWVHENHRKRHYGFQLFAKLECLAHENKCKHIQVQTAEFQARGFYEKLGFTVIAELSESFMGYSLYIMKKSLSKIATDY